MRGMQKFALILVSLLQVWAIKSLSIGSYKTIKPKKLLSSIITSASLGASLVVPQVHAADSPPVVKVPDYGLRKGRLLPCKQKSNCISTSSINSVEKYSTPWEYTKSADDQFADVVNALKTQFVDQTQLKIVEQDNEKRYVRAEGKSVVPPTGVDDVEILVNSLDKIITYRSNSRELISTGSGILGDAGSNRNRLVTVKNKLGLREMAVSDDAETYINTKKNQANWVISNFNIQDAAQKPSEINFIDNSVPDAPIAPSTAVSDATVEIPAAAK